MAVKLQLHTAVIPVEIGEFKFQVNLADDREKVFKRELEGFLSKIEQMDEESFEDQEKLPGMLQEMYDQLLGAGSYDQLYAHTPNVGILSGVFVQVVAGLTKEMQSRITSAPVSKVIERKKKAAKNKPGV